MENWVTYFRPSLDHAEAWGDKGEGGRISPSPRASPTSRLRVKLRRAKGERKSKVMVLFVSPAPVSLITNHLLLITHHSSHVMILDLGTWNLLLNHHIPIEPYQYGVVY